MLGFGQVPKFSHFYSRTESYTKNVTTSGRQYSEL